jgi:hypothetical protein
MRGSTLASIAALVVFGIIVADLVAHPTGTLGASQGVATILTPTYSALLGGGAINQGS